MGGTEKNAHRPLQGIGCSSTVRVSPGTYSLLKFPLKSSHRSRKGAKPSFSLLWLLVSLSSNLRWLLSFRKRSLLKLAITSGLPSVLLHRIEVGVQLSLNAPMWRRHPINPSISVTSMCLQCSPRALYPSLLVHFAIISIILALTNFLYAAPAVCIFLWFMTCLIGGLNIFLEGVFMGSGASLHQTLPSLDL